MAWRLNKGDWSEAYVFLKLLAEGRIYSGDEDLNKVLSVYMDVLKILKIFGEIRDIKKEIAIFYLKMCMKGRKSIADKILSKMGRKNIGDWLKL